MTFVMYAMTPHICPINGIGCRCSNIIVQIKYIEMYGMENPSAALMNSLKNIFNGWFLSISTFITHDESTTVAAFWRDRYPKITIPRGNRQAKCQMGWSRALK